MGLLSVRRAPFGVTLRSKSASTSEVDALLAVKLLREARQPLRLTRFSKQLYNNIPFRGPWIGSNSFLGVPNHGPGQALLLGTPVPNHGFVPI